MVRGRLRSAARFLRVYSSALRKTLTVIGILSALAAASALAAGLDPRGAFEIVQEIRAPEAASEWVLWGAAFVLKLSPVLGFVEAAGLNREQRMEMAVRAMEGHVLVIGLGHLGARVARRLLGSGAEVAALVLPSDRGSNECLEDLEAEGLRVVFGDATTRSALLRAGVDAASAVILTIDDDLTNAAIADRVRKLNPGARVVVRVFREELADILRESGAADVTLSTSDLSSDAFAVASELEVRGGVPVPSPVEVSRGLAGRSVGELGRSGLRVIAVLGPGGWEPVDGTRVLEEGEVVLLAVTPGGR